MSRVCADVLFRILVELRLAAFGAEIVRLPFIVAVCRSGLGINRHPTYDIFHHLVISLFKIYVP